MTGIINKSTLENIEGIFPPFSMQRAFGTLAAEVRELATEQGVSRRHSEAFFESLLDRAFAGDL
jgi:hypothetical protein